MLETQQNKMQKRDKIKTADMEDESVEQEYSFTDHGVVIRARSLEEAHEKLQEYLNNK